MDTDVPMTQPRTTGNEDFLPSSNEQIDRPLRRPRGTSPSPVPLPVKPSPPIPAGVRDLSLFETLDFSPSRRPVRLPASGCPSPEPSPPAWDGRNLSKDVHPRGGHFETPKSNTSYTHLQYTPEKGKRRSTSRDSRGKSRKGDSYHRQS